MAPFNGERLTNGHASGGAHRPPPSSILATHFAPVHGNGSVSTLPDFDKNSFDLLLEESLGHDEHGEPNLGTDIGTNHKLISVLFKAGIDRTFGQSENPFNAYPVGRDGVQIQLCLDVIKLAVQRSPRVLFVPTPHSEAIPGEQIPLYALLVPKLLVLLTTCEEPKKSFNEKVRGVLAAVLGAGSLCSKPTSLCSTISAFFYGCSEALLQNLESSEPSSVTQRSGWLSNEKEAFIRALAKLHNETNPEHADISVQTPRASLAALTATACSVAALADFPDAAKTSQMLIASQVLDHLERIWPFVVESLEDAQTGMHSLLIDFFDTLQRLRPAACEGSLTTSKQRCTLLWAGAFSDCVDSIYSLMDDDSREALRGVLTSTLDAATTDTAFCEILSEILDSRLLVVRDEGQLDSELHVSENLTGLETNLTLVKGTGLRHHRSNAGTTGVDWQSRSRTQCSSIRQ
jgi:hypothetical protein